jgi:hypothetical protein
MLSEQTWLHSIVLVVAEKGLHSFKAFSIFFFLFFIFFHVALPVRRLWLQKSWEATQPGHLSQTGQRDIPYHIES